MQNGPALKADGWAPLLTSLGLPVDQLSRTILSFAKFFSLPFDPGLLANARKAGFGGKDREAQALANLAAVDKGVSATPAALQEYASLLHV
ncbi:MAG: hypothetical protein FWF29_00255, partial [Treponema sp.]|nr:hypothetical protein [Treponema sp.]